MFLKILPRIFFSRKSVSSCFAFWCVCVSEQNCNCNETITTMFIFVPNLLRSRFSVHHKIFQIKSVVFLICLNICLKFSVVIAGPTIQQEQELLLLEALSKRQPSYYGTSNSLMDILGRSMYFIYGVYRLVCINIGLSGLFWFFFANRTILRDFLMTKKNEILEEFRKYGLFAKNNQFHFCFKLIDQLSAKKERGPIRKIHDDFQRQCFPYYIHWSFFHITCVSTGASP